MSKTNFTKVEEALTQGLQKIQLDKLLQEADAVKGGAEPPAKPPEATVLEERRRRVHALNLSLKWLNTKDPDLYVRLSVSKADIKKFLDKVDKFTDKDWKTFETLQEKVDKIKQDREALQGIKGDEDIVAQQRLKHINKRFNVQDKWLPLK